MHGPDPNDPHPMRGFPQICYIRNTIDNPQIQVGEYSYYDDPEDSEGFARNVLYLFPFIGDRLIIGRYCAIARGATFVMNGANHRMSGFSTYPFNIFGNGWERSTPLPQELPYKGDTVVGNDVWIGYEAMLMPGVRVGDGAIIAARSVVSADVPAYAIVGGNPVRVLRMRYDDAQIERLLRIAWWDWDADKVSRHLELIVGADLDALEAAQ
ncbi:CatB-related O-acetyltransferase [Lysobacter sp. CCNWLW3]|uniref:CatB-related O-acetyltransferase n=1 Tax=unclassified Lysobacter TaxID=2635362 RepID=UPI002FD1CB35